MQLFIHTSGEIFMACVANFPKSKPEIFPFGSVRSPVACFILFPMVLGSRTPFPSVQRWNSNVMHTGQLVCVFPNALENRGVRQTWGRWETYCSDPLLPFQGFAEGNADLAKIFCPISSSRQIPLSTLLLWWIRDRYLDCRDWWINVAIHIMWLHTIPLPYCYFLLTTLFSCWHLVSADWTFEILDKGGALFLSFYPARTAKNRKDFGWPPSYREGIWQMGISPKESR